MRVLFVSSPGVGHVFPMVPLAWAFRAAGHEVLVATSGEALAVAGAGLPVVDIAPGLNRAEVMARLRRERPDIVQAMLTAEVRDLNEIVEAMAEIAPVLFDGALAVAREWRPDLVVQSQGQSVGLLVAGVLGIPLVEHNFGIIRATGTQESVYSRLASTFDSYGFAMPTSREWIDVAPPSMGAAPVGLSMRYIPYNGGAVLPSWLRSVPERPRVAVTLGTVAPGMTGIGPVGQIISCAKEIDAEFVLALGDVDLGGFGPLPENVRAAGWVPLNALLPSCAAIVHHGGAGSTMAALDAGVPQLVLPSGADRYVNADAVVRRGVGVRAVDVDASVLRAVVGGGFRAVAVEVREEMRAMRAPAGVVAVLAGS
ncbi:nucleotide disphospho-sugar-binding domain-containing protein [Allokutzneria albata]|uniref:UDP:flavonoid glycosyltransferase YjiC, YdhE family n=1 Tax=Allokutzneria albata TaxID=211114 RepID=A0A1G9VXK1_ALLAB|nr:nucleotide disphospho-sugar-binding domain-containing protein [Allokutzneria albata]SDM76575.1 UDP:flavonoid glycosyltransferase YjiC, YdhE family [Allokutzneria albata]